jgi:hypothetical protein
VKLPVKDESEFPGGLRIEAAQQSGAFEVIFNQPYWPGPVQWTENGYPYFGSQDEVLVRFPNPAKASALRFIQASSGRAHNWSVNEIELWGE